MRKNAKAMALGGITAALAIVMQTMGGLIPVATFVVPMLSMLLLQFVTDLCGKKMGWAWYCAVSLLGLLLGPDKEAAGVFLALGYYPIIKPWLDGRKGRLLYKLLFFNVSVLLLYRILMALMGAAALGLEFGNLGIWMTAITLILGNVTFFLLDMVLSKFALRGDRRG